MWKKGNLRTSMWWNTIFVTCSCRRRRVLAYHVSAQMQIWPYRSFLCVSGVHSHPKTWIQVSSEHWRQCLSSERILSEICMKYQNAWAPCLPAQWISDGDFFSTHLSACTRFHWFSEFLLILLWFAVKVLSVASNAFLFFTLVFLFVHGTNPSLCACVRVLLITPYWTLPMQL